MNIRLDGVLDGQTGRNVYLVFEELLQEGYVDLAMQVDELDPSVLAGLSSLVGIERLFKSVGGLLRWPRFAECPEQRRVHLTAPV